MKAIVTGASGFIGSRLVAELVGRGYQVAALGRRGWSQLPGIRKKHLEGSSYIEANLDEIDRVQEILRSEGFHGRELKFFFHLAWGGGNKLSDLDVKAQSENIARTVSTYCIADGLNAERYIFSGTMEEAFAEKYTTLD
jgi:nucleoside-diphosphate-sugar epimerase